MATATLAAVPKFPVGTTLEALPHKGEGLERRPGGAAVDTSVVAADGTVTFDNLALGVPHVAGAVIGGRWQAVAFMPHASVAELTEDVAYLTGPFETDSVGPNWGQLTIAPSVSTNPEGVAQISLVPNNAVANLQDRDALIAFHPEQAHVEDATIKCHRHVDSGGTPTDRHIQIHTKDADGLDLTSRLEIQYLTDDAYVLITSAHLKFDTNAYIKTPSSGLVVKSSAGVQTFAFTDSGLLTFGSTADTNLYRSAANRLATDDQFYATLEIRAFAGDAGQVTIGEAGTAKIYFGTAFDTNLYRSAADTLKTDDKLHVAGELEVDGDLNHDGTNVGFYGVAPTTRPTAYTQTYATADKTLGAYTPDVESSAYTGAADGEAKLTDLNALRVAYENLRAFTEDLAQQHNSVLDDLQAVGLLQ